MVIRDKEYLKKEIIDQSRHQFIYGYNDENRKSLIKELEIEYPIVKDETSQIAINPKNIFLPNIEIEGFDKYKLSLIATEYLRFNIALELLLRTQSQFPDINMSNLTTYFEENITKIEELIKHFKESIDFYKYYYEEYLKNEDIKISIDEILISFLDIETFIRKYKKDINNQSYISILVDNVCDSSIYSIRAINDLIGSRINKNISMKIFTEPDKWNSYIGTNKETIDSVHDYEILCMDESYKEYTRKLRKRNSILYDK